ncbi:MAG: 50S ribosomal protein L11 [Candidatus Micrarchaeia archaeon]
MAKQTINALVSGGKASAGPPLGPAIGPTGINIQKVISAINEKTKDFAGIQVPVKVIIDTSTKEFEIEVGTPPMSALIVKEIGIEKGAGNKETIAGNITMDKVVKLAKMKRDSLNTASLKNGVLQVLGTCVSLNVTCEGKNAKEVIREVKQGAYDKLFKE